MIISITYWLIISLLEVSHLRIFNSFFLQYIWEFNIGIFLGYKYVNNEMYMTNIKNYILLFISIFGITLNDIPASIGYSTLVFLTYRILSNSNKIRFFIINIGNISYELYLLHMLVFHLTNDILQKVINLRANILISLFFILPLSIVTARFVSFFLVYMRSYFTVIVRKFPLRNINTDS